MVTLFCAIVGVAESAFLVCINASQSVGHLKDAIKAKKMYNFPADGLRLFLAKTADCKWLSDESDAAVELEEGKMHQDIQTMLDGEKMRATKSLQYWLFERNNMPQPSATDQIHVLVKLPDLDQQQRVESADESLSLLRGLRRDFMEFKERTTSLPHNKHQFYSDSGLGQLEKQKLKEDERLTAFVPVEGREAFWSEEIQLQADAITNEAAFDAFITPFFDTILDSCGLVFVHSERYPWLSRSPHVSKNADLKPDGFATHRGMFHGRPVPNDGVPRPSGFRFGVAEEELVDCLVWFESKLRITDAAFGRVARHLQHLCPDASASAVLFDRSSFWLIKSRNGSAVRAEVAMWVDTGSKALFQDFITENVSPWVARLSLACSCLGVDVLEGEAFLGRGAYGRVFKVAGQDGEVIALKIVERCSVGRLYREEKALTTAQHTGLTIRTVGKLLETPESAALLLTPVGRPLPPPTTAQEVRDLFELLWKLHANDLVHGDPRVPNVILDGVKPLWIDLVEVREASSALKQVDAEILTRSILRISSAVALDRALKQLIEQYGRTTSRADLDHLAEVVCQSLVFSS